MKHILLLLSAIAGISFSAGLLAVQPEQVLTKYNSLNPIVSRWGLEVNQEWDALLELVLKSDPAPSEQNLKQAYNIILGAKIGQGQETASYVLDLYKIFKQKPAQLIEHSQKYFGGVNQCLLYWLIPKTQFIEFKEFKADMNGALKKDPKSKMLKAFEKEAQQYFTAIKSGKSIPALAKCNLYAIKTR